MTKTAKTKKRNKRGNHKTLIILLIVFATIAVASMVISYFITDDNPSIFSQKTEQSDESKVEELQNIKTLVEGTWVSNYDGAILTITGLSFTIENPGVDNRTKTSGNLAIEQNLVTFINSGGELVCKDIEGHYQFTFEKDEVSFKLIKDNCESRIERMTASWFRL